MKLTHYDLTFSVADPDDAETHVTITMNRIPREKLLEMPLIGNALKTLEESVVDEGEESTHGR